MSETVTADIYYSPSGQFEADDDESESDDFFSPSGQFEMSPVWQVSQVYEEEKFYSPSAALQIEVTPPPPARAPAQIDFPLSRVRGELQAEIARRTARDCDIYSNALLALSGSSLAQQQQQLTGIQTLNRESMKQIIARHRASVQDVHVVVNLPPPSAPPLSPPSPSSPEITPPPTMPADLLPPPAPEPFEPAPAPAPVPAPVQRLEGPVIPTTKKQLLRAERIFQDSCEKNKYRPKGKLINKLLRSHYWTLDELTTILKRKGVMKLKHPRSLQQVYESMTKPQLCALIAGMESAEVRKFALEHLNK